MSSDSIVQRLGPHQAALFAATGSAIMLLLAAGVLFVSNSSLYWVVLAVAPVDFALVYVLLKRTFERA
ncbi:hypothetical protein [Haloarchaeobius salinus]|uniref:hypothetical protein n=1 Tax=Haloarchaeobius salinus TaxID=1198298 RepID=UPI00210CD50D|nr:hypothetical protein [Haloarchaeobius salinus]